MEVHGLVAFELILIDRHCLCMDAGLLSLPRVWFCAHLDAVKSFGWKQTTFKVKLGKCP
jgi:hypothetical protein